VRRRRGGRWRGGEGDGGALSLACRYPSSRRGTFFVRGSHVSHDRRPCCGGVLARQILCPFNGGASKNERSLAELVSGFQLPAVHGQVLKATLERSLSLKPSAETRRIQHEVQLAPPRLETDFRG
jgi:hypothetical protein